MVVRNYTFTWKGVDVDAKVTNAIERASVAWGEQVSNKAKERAHRLSGTLSRSIHAAKGSYDQDDTGAAVAGVMPIVVDPVPEWEGETALVSAGSWINYAEFERRRGGGHDWLTGPAGEANGRYGQTIRQALVEEGVR